MLRTGLSWSERIVYWAVILGLLVVLAFYHRTTMPVAIFVNGKPVVWVSNFRSANRTVELAKDQLQKQYGHNVNFAEAVDADNLPLAPGGKLMSPAEASDLLFKSVSPAREAWLIVVNDQVVTALRSKQEAEQALDLVKVHFTPKDVILVREPWFKEKVTVQEGKITIGEIVADAETVAQKLLSGPEPPQYHVVKAGEFAVRIARRYRLTLKELQWLNPDKNLDRLKIGDNLLVKRGKPLVTVVCVYQVVKQETVPFKTERRFAPHLPGGTLITKQRGKEGLKEVVLEITTENGLEVQRKVVKEQILKEPVTEVILVGGGLR